MAHSEDGRYIGSSYYKEKADADIERLRQNDSQSSSQCNRIVNGVKGDPLLDKIAQAHETRDPLGFEQFVFQKAIQDLIERRKP